MEIRYNTEKRTYCVTHDMGNGNKMEESFAMERLIQYLKQTRDIKINPEGMTPEVGQDILDSLKGGKVAMMKEDETIIQKFYN